MEVEPERIRHLTKSWAELEGLVAADEIVESNRREKIDNIEQTEMFILWIFLILLVFFGVV